MINCKSHLEFERDAAFSGGAHLSRRSFSIPGNVNVTTFHFCAYRNPMGKRFGKGQMTAPAELQGAKCRGCMQVVAPCMGPGVSLLHRPLGIHILM